MRLFPRLLRPLVALVALLPAVAHAQTWVDGRRTPGLDELFAVDATGETPWPFGIEDVAGDGPTTFTAAEQAADLRSAYAASAAGRLWLRLYVSSEVEVADGLTAHAFIDTDQNPTTGGAANATDVDDRLGPDPSGGGYERVLSFERDLGLIAVWRWNEGSGQFEAQGRAELESESDAGTDLDPLRVNADTHGYLQLSSRLRPIGLGGLCQARLFVRSVDDAGLGDLDLGEVGPCVSRDSDHNSIADVAEPASGCSDDEDCPGGATCTAGVCELGAGVDGEDALPGDLQVQGGALTCALGARGRPFGHAGDGAPGRESLLAVLAVLGLGWRRRRRPDRDGRARDGRGLRHAGREKS